MARQLLAGSSEQSMPCYREYTPHHRSQYLQHQCANSQTEASKLQIELPLPLEISRKPAMSQRKTITLLLCIGWTAYIGYSAITETGLYGKMVSFVNSVFGSYDPTMIGTGLWIVPIMLVVFTLLPRETKALAAQQVKSESEEANTSPEHTQLVIWEKSIPYLARSVVVGVLASALCAGIGLNMSDEDPVPTTLEFAELVEGSTSSGLVEIKGIVLTDAMTGIEETVSNHKTFTAYAPIIGPDAEEAGTEAAPLQYFQKVESSYAPSEGFFDAIGYLKREKLPVLVRESYAEAGLVLAEETYVIDSASLDWRDTLFMISSLIGVATFLLITFWIIGLIQRRKLRKLRKEAATANPLAG